jgi:hypothetical protein
MSKDYIKSLMDAVGTFASSKELAWSYDEPSSIAGKPVDILSLGLDGALVHCIEDGKGAWREAMVGTVTHYDGNGERLHTLYVGASPEYGREKFLAHLTAEWDKAKARYPNAVTQGLADGAASNWVFLKDKTDFQVLDFWHVSTYVTDAATGLFGAKEDNPEKKAYIASWLHTIKHSDTGVAELSEDIMERMRRHERESKKKKLKKLDIPVLMKVLEYFKNNAHRTHYLSEWKAGRPIGSGVTEAACKTLIKARMCQAGMRWKSTGASSVIAVRSLLLTEGRWAAFWDKIIRYGFKVIGR